MLHSRMPRWQDLPLPQQVAQMVVVRASGHLFDHQIQYPVWEPPAAVLQRWISELGVGGVILLGGGVAEVALRTQQFQDWADVPLFIAADIEEGVGQRFTGAITFPPPMTIGAIAASNLAQAITYAERMGAATAEEALAIGINWILAPVVDVNNNPLNPVINLRAWGETTEIVSRLATAFIAGTQHHRVLTTAKHFPGHGDTAIDSHLDLPLMAHDRTRLAEVELPPFEAAIAAGVDAVMTAHLQLPAWDTERPATFSRSILTDLLRQQLGFSGLIVTDALVMGAITRSYDANEAAVMAVEAGADLLMMPADPAGAIAAVCKAVETGRISLTQIEASLERIWQAKQKVSAPIGDGSHAWETLSQPAIQLNQLAQPQTIATVEAILQDGLQQHRPAGSRLNQVGARRNLILIDDALNCSFLNRQAPAITIPTELGYELQLVDSYTPEVDWQKLGHKTDRRPTLLQLFIRGNPFRSSAQLIQTAEKWLQFLLNTEQLSALAIYGSPYVRQQLQLPPDLPYVFTHGQIPAAQAVALEALFAEVKGDRAVIKEFTD